MLDVKSILFLVWLNINIGTGNLCVEHKYVTHESTNQILERKTMNSNQTFQITNHEVTFQNTKDNITLSGTLSVPQTSQLPPVVLLVSGMGPNDRDYTIMGHTLFLDLANYLNQHGIAVLRYDKRGVGKSGGVFNMQLTSADLAQDVVAAVEFLSQRSDINNKQIGLIGHSEGGLISFMVTSQSADVSFLISMAGATSNDVVTHFQMQLKADGATDQFLASDKIIRDKMFDIIKTQSEHDAEIALTALLKSYVESLTDEQKIEEVHLPFAITHDNYLQMIATFNSPWYRFYLKINALDFISKVTVPVLAMNGDLDFIISSTLALPKIEQGLKIANNQNVTIKAIANQNHWFQECQTGSLMEYGAIKETIHASTLKLMADWIKRTTESFRG